MPSTRTHQRRHCQALFTKILSEIGITPLQVVNRFTRGLLEQAHRSEVLMGRAEPSVEMPEAAIALARRAQVARGGPPEERSSGQAQRIGAQGGAI